MANGNTTTGGRPTPPSNDRNTLRFENMTDYTDISRLAAEDLAIAQQLTDELSEVDRTLKAAEALLQTSNAILNIANSIIEDGTVSPELIEQADIAMAPGLQGIVNTSQQFRVPYNPLSPPEYAEILNYESIQYLNGFLRTQIGKYVRITSLIGSDDTTYIYGFLVGVGINYIIIQEFATGNITTLDFYNIKSVYFYYTLSPVLRTDLPPAPIANVDLSDITANPVNSQSSQVLQSAEMAPTPGINIGDSLGDISVE